MSLSFLCSVTRLVGAKNLKTASFVAAAFGIASPIFLVASCLAELSVLVIVIWILMGIHVAFSGALLYGIFENAPVVMTVWIWFTLIYVPIMIVLFCILIFAFGIDESYVGVVFAIIGIIYLLVTIFFILIVNSYREELESKKK